MYGRASLESVRCLIFQLKRALGLLGSKSHYVNDRIMVVGITGRSTVDQRNVQKAVKTTLKTLVLVAIIIMLSRGEYQSEE